MHLISIRESDSLVGDFVAAFWAVLNRSRLGELTNVGVSGAHVLMSSVFKGGGLEVFVRLTGSTKGDSVSAISSSKVPCDNKFTECGQCS